MKNYVPGARAQRALFLKINLIILTFFFVNNNPVSAKGLITPAEHNRSLGNKGSQRILTGTVIDDKGLPIFGVTVRVKGTDRGAITDDKGKYQIQINDPADVLVFSGVGYRPQEIIAGQQKSIDVMLKPLPQQDLKEVSVVAYGTQKKIDVIGAQSSVDVGDLKQPVANLTALLAGRVAGIVGVQRSGMPGRDGADFYIRGLSNFVSSGQISPLILVDGVEESIGSLNVEDIQTFTILKDASATAVYGVRGANGVVLVQTKRGKAGKPAITADYYEGLSTFTRIPKMADGITYMNAVNEALTTRGGQPKYSAALIQNTASGKDPLLYPNVNWINSLFNKYSQNRQGNLHISGGSPNTIYYVSVSYLNQTGLLKSDNLESYNSKIDYSRYNFVSNLDLGITKTTKVSLYVNGFVGKGNYPSQDPSSIFGYAMTVPPVEFPTVYPGNFVPGNSANGSEPNPYGQLTQSGYSTDFTTQVNSQLKLAQDLGFWVPGLSFNSTFAYDTSNGFNLVRSKNPNTYLIDPNTPYNADGTPNLFKTYASTSNFLSFGTGSSGSYQIYTESSLNYDHSFGKNHVGGLLLFNQRETTSYPASSFVYYIPHHDRGYAGRLTYSYDERYFAEVNAGYTGSENFAPGNRYGFFPAATVGWLISQEPFFSSFKKAVPLLKLRYSDGFVGYDNTGGPRFAYLTILNNQSDGFAYGLNRNGLAGINFDTYGVNATWAKARKRNLGIDLSLFNVVSITVDAYQEHRTKVALQLGSIPTFVGLATAPFGNAGIIDSKGIDGTITADLKLGEMALNLRGTFTYSRAKIIQNNQPTPPYPWMDQRGQSPIAQFGYLAEGLFSSQAEINSSAVLGDKSTIKPGDIKYKDLNNDGIINAYDMTKISDGDLPAFTYGMGFNAEYHRFYLNGFFQGTANSSLTLGGPAIQPFSTNGGVSNAFANITDRWTTENPSQNVFYPRLAYGTASNTNNTRVSSWWVKDISYIRLKTLDLGYNFPKALFAKMGVKSSSVYIEGYNLLTFSKFKLWDPEATSSNGTGYPNVKTLVLGLRAQFN